MNTHERLLENRAIQCLKDINFSLLKQKNKFNENQKYVSASFTDLMFNISFIAKHYEFSYHLYKNNDFKIIYFDKEGKSLDVPFQDIHKEKILTLIQKVKNIYSNQELFRIEENKPEFNKTNVDIYKNKLEIFSIEDLKIFFNKLTLHKADFFSKSNNSMLNFSVEDNKLLINQTEYCPQNINNPYFLISPLDLKNDLIIKLNNKDYSYEDFIKYMDTKPLKNKIKP